MFNQASPIHIIHFTAVGSKSSGEPYACDFTITFPADKNIPVAEVNVIVSQAITEFKNMHPTGQIKAKQEKTIMAGGPRAQRDQDGNIHIWV